MGTREYTLEDFKSSARQFVQQLTPAREATVVALHGDLGAGKTTFVQEVAHTLGIYEDVVSPTFVIQKNYLLEGQVFGKLVHIDAYRLENAEELKVLGWEDVQRDPANLVCIEWAENVADLLAPETHHVYFAYVDDDTRSIAHGKEH